MSALPAAVHVAPSARVLTATSAVLWAKLGALTMFMIVGLVSVCLWTGYPVDLMPQSRRLPVIAIMGMVACAIGLPLSRNRGPMSVTSGKPLESGVQGLAASESTSVGRRGRPARASASSSLTAASRCPP